MLAVRQAFRKFTLSGEKDMISIALIGSTGSIGRQVCNVVRRYPEKYRFTSLVANSNTVVLGAQTAEFRPKYSIILKKELLPTMPEFDGEVSVQAGEENALKSIEEADVVFVAASGFAGLKYSLKAIECQKRLALANKETLVCGGEIVMREAEKRRIDLVPVDSEHSALWQALHFDRHADFSRLIVTASGGPFYGYTKEQLKTVTVERALAHPTWKMGAKITVDSATLLNKGFEVIEAKWLYNAPFEKIHTVVQPESIIHSMVEFADGGILAQMSYPTMELPIQLALTYPERADCALKPLDFETLGAIHFKPLRRKDFPCYDLALQAGEAGDNYPCALNGAGEVAVNAFLLNKIPFVKISEVIEKTLSATERRKVTNYGDLCEVDRKAREEAEKIIRNA
jgi:1-deoxy-D-xylulose-5-phosphate reductoisomerase